MEPKLKIKIEQAVREILEESDMNSTTEYQIRKAASERLELDLNKSEYKAFVRHVVNTFLEEQKAKEEEEEAADDGDKTKNKEYDDDGDLIICRLSDKRRVTIQDFRGTTLVSIREYYKKDGKELPTAKVQAPVSPGVGKRIGNYGCIIVCIVFSWTLHIVGLSGISLKEEQWAVLKKNIPAVEKAIRKMEARVI